MISFGYEAHITVEPHDEMPYGEFVESARELGWKASIFEADEVDHADGKWFLSCSSAARNTLINEVKGMVHGLSSSGFEVARWKIEATVADSKLGHELDHIT